MFYYISFLRPPPSQAGTDPILITPQICNDLRTEFLDEPVDIYYSWSLHAQHPASPTTTKPTKLTSWRTSTAYKEITVPRPPQNNKSRNVGGPSWRLILTCGTTHDDSIIFLGETCTTGNTPFAVMSMPVQFPHQPGHGLGNRGAVKAKTTKQEQIVRSYSLRIPIQDRPVVFNITEQTSFDLDKKVWDSGIGLSSWLAQFFSGKVADASESLSKLRESLFSADARHILELGAGTGIVAITLAVLRSTLELPGQAGSIVTTDLPSAMPILQHNITSNHSLTTKCVLQAAVLDWDHEELPSPVQTQLEAGLDVITIADVAYNTASFSALVRTLTRLIQSCRNKRNGRSPRVLMGYKERHPDERLLWDLAKENGLHFRQIALVAGSGRNPVEIWLG